MGFKPSEIPERTPNLSQLLPNELPLLVPYLHGKDGFRRTFEKLWWIIETPKGYKKSSQPYIGEVVKRLELLPGIEHRPGVRWVALNMHANQERLAKECQGDQIAPSWLAGPEILAALVQFPEWISYWDRTPFPSPNFGGYIYHQNNYKKEVLCVRVNDEHELGLNTNWSSVLCHNQSTPTIRLLESC